MKKLVIAIDGPAASGKSTTARLVAGRLGYLHIDTGAMYRAMTVKVLRAGIDPADEAAVGALADLSGEVTVVGGKVYVSRAAGGEAQTEVSEDTDAGAALLVSARVPAWRQVSSTQPIGFDMLEGRIEELAKEAGLDVGGRIPFVVEGRVRELEWHVLGGAPPGGSAGEIQVRESSGYARLDNAARDTVRGWRFVPARRGETAVPAWVLIPISFRLEG